ncbi:MAG: ABC transporter permease [Eubacteriales bacterium]|nr:ABC transporter permease [Eubacteriales bacterium]
MSAEPIMRKVLPTVGRLIQTAWKKYSFVFVFFIILFVYSLTIEAAGNTFRWQHITAILSSQNTVIVGTIALGMGLVIITGQIDLSIGSALVLTTGATIVTFNVTDNIIITLLAALAAGAIAGGINGVLVGYAKMPPFIVTLGTMLIYRSISLYLVREISPDLTGSSSSQFAMLKSNQNYEAMRMKFGTGSLPGLSIPYITFVFIITVIIFVFIMSKTKYGKSIYAVGSNEKASHLAGVNVQWKKVSVFIITGMLVGLASFIQAAKIGNITPASSGKSYEMYAIAAVVLGGINMAGGRGNILGVFFGALSYTTINFIIVSVPSLSTDIQDTFQGLVLIIVILVQTIGPVIRERLQEIKKWRH